MTFKLLLIPLVFCFVNSFSQDVIIQLDGAEIESKVIEIEEDKIKYRLFNQPDGPIRNILISDVFMILYENGQREYFTSKTDKVGEKLDSINHIYKSRFFLDGGAGYANFAEDHLGLLAAKFGYKWILGSGKRYRPGFQIVGLQAQAYFGNYFILTLSPVRIGLVNCFKLSKGNGIELNLNAGYAFSPVYEDVIHGGMGNLEFKYLVKKLSVGLDMGLYFDVNGGIPHAAFTVGHSW